MAEIAIAASFTIFAQEKFTGADIASAEKVLVIENVFFIVNSPSFLGYANYKPITSVCQAVFCNFV
jgi:hypothetical protein